ncbi:unnamed protein product [Staurois parvus]|uniref:Uncharacterized protein n=1 Tax=Staurois parvus TaxID=386267 RepID=A0ABN9BDQ4_9NEOB|nr:unnamed protein product [Staurois parvus]
MLIAAEAGLSDENTAVSKCY